MGQGTKRVAIVIELRYPLPWHHDCYQGILRYGEAHGWDCVLDPFLVGMTPSMDPAKYDGVVGRFNKAMGQRVDELGLTAVNHLNRSLAGHLPSVSVDAKSGSKLAAEHLIANGFQRFAYFGFAHDMPGPDHDGFSEAIQSHGFAPPECCPIDIDFESSGEKILAMREAVSAWLETIEHPVGILCRSGLIARYIAQTCLEVGLRVPQDLGIVVGDGESVIVSNATPTLTSIDYDFVALGYEAAAMLDKLMKGKPADPLQRVLPPDRLIIRESSDVFVCADPLVAEAMRYIAEHVRQTLTVDELAEATNTSRRTLERRFDEVLGRKVYGEIRRLRIDYIQRLLIETDRSISNIAHDCGFGNTSHFARYFRKEAGQSPSAFRARYRG